MIVQSEISEVALAPVWYRPGFLMDVFGLTRSSEKANESTSMKYVHRLSWQRIPWVSQHLTEF